MRNEHISLHPKGPLLSVHIEKTAGTSLQEWFEQVFGARFVYLYHPDSMTLRLAGSKLLPGLSRTNSLVDASKRIFTGTPILPFATKIYSKYKQYQKPVTIDKVMEHAVVHGHFLATQFDSFFPRAPKVVVLRNPLDRMYSQYAHWKRAEGMVDYRVKIPYRSDLQFEEFALLPQLTNFQTTALDGCSLRDFVAVGTTEHMDVFLNALWLFLTSNGFVVSGPVPRLKSLNTSVRKVSEVPVNEQFRKKFQLVHSDDYSLWNQVTQYNQN